MMSFNTEIADSRFFIVPWTPSHRLSSGGHSFSCRCFINSRMTPILHQHFQIHVKQCHLLMVQLRNDLRFLAPKSRPLERCIDMRFSSWIKFGFILSLLTICFAESTKEASCNAFEIKSHSAENGVLWPFRMARNAAGRRTHHSWCGSRLPPIIDHGASPRAIGRSSGVMLEPC